MKVYLAGGFRSGWRDTVIAARPDYIYLNPQQHGLTDPGEYTALDLKAIADSQIIFAYLEADNPGGPNLALEMGFAFGLGASSINSLKRTIIFVDEKEKYYSMAKAIANEYFTSFGYALEYWKKVRFEVVESWHIK